MEKERGERECARNGFMCVQAAHNYIVNMIFGNGTIKRFVYFDALDKYKRKIMKENRYITIYSCITSDSMLSAPGIYRSGVMESENETEGRSRLKVEKTKHAMPPHKSTVNMPLNFAFDGKWKQTMVFLCASDAASAAVVAAAVFFPRVLKLYDTNGCFRTLICVYIASTIPRPGCRSS